MTICSTNNDYAQNTQTNNRLDNADIKQRDFLEQKSAIMRIQNYQSQLLSKVAQK